ncbi:two-component system response regulator NarL [Shewanella schlegeliana]|uniref:Two-component system response regulator NarL n=1 Tax=Shewanella schlegeliana TaxID=190308 RepID=A0ABS1T1P4_9GAMM|nr:two-component system response regulator NarL [Shewanella schlegeliana]MBL4914715.1 two-component system response regulator NarL [Shewanella schlegeliana]MCL1109953.1 two-component system response regulator NarL [Shewanella schlegeliana]GIU25499.1 DNA-binding response regulator [Shewanella schlegeliana]
MPIAKILLVDDHPALRQGLAQLMSLEDSLDVVAQASSGEEAISLAVQYEPDIILLDLNMRGLSGIDTLISLKNAQVKSKVVIFTVSDNESDVLQAIKFNTDGYLLKDSEPEELIEKIHLALQGEFVISSPLTQILAQSLRSGSKKVSQLEELTQRELQIVKLIASGKSNKEIANKLGITDSTVKVHVKNLLKKLALKSRVEVVLWAVENKISQ